MPVVRPFKAVRPAADFAPLTAALPYDVYTRTEAREAILGRPYTFLRIDRADAVLPEEIDMYAPKVYETARELYLGDKATGIYKRDDKSCFYLYELTMGGRSQTGIVAVSAVDDYLNGTIRKHENTVAAKEEDRVRHIAALSAQTGPIFLAYRDDMELSRIVERWSGEHEPVYDFVSDDGVRHRVRVIDDDSTIAAIAERFSSMDHTYIADGHHRAASAVRVSLALREQAKTHANVSSGEHSVDHEYDYFLSVLFPAGELRILDYNRTVRDTGELSKAEFLDALTDTFIINYIGSLESSGAESLRPSRKFEFGLYLGGDIYMLSLREEIAQIVSSDPVSSLDASVLQQYVFSDLLGIADPRTDERIDFIGGIRGMEGLIMAADRCGGPAWALYPTSMDELMRVADMGLLMPPKSTWFEPKLRSGLFIHEF